MGADVALDTPLHPLTKAMLERGLLAGIRFYVPDHAHEAVLDRHASETAAAPGQLRRWSEAPETTLHVSVSSTVTEDTPEAMTIVICEHANRGQLGTARSTLVVHDMLPPVGNESLKTMFLEWFNQPDTPVPCATKGGYWCSMSDVVGAFIRLLPSMKVDNETYHVCGRRFWTIADTRTEFLALAERTQAGLTGRFAAHHLVSDRMDPIALEGVETTDDRPDRPDIAPFHRQLESLTGEGWRPTMPLRQSLMLVLAELSQLNEEVR